VPAFCRHNRFEERCPICRPPGSVAPAERSGSSRSAAGGARGSATTGREGMRVRRETRAADDGYRTTLVPGIRSSDDAGRLATEIAFATGRLQVLADERRPGPYAEVAAATDPEQALWTALLIAYLGPLEGDDPFAAIGASISDWSSGELPDLDGVALGPRTSHDSARGLSTLAAYRQWAARSGSQLQAFTGDSSWPAERRFDRVFERLTLPGFGRAGRYELLASVGAIGRVELSAGSMQLVGDDPTVLAAKRVFGIGDRPNLERRAAALAEVCGVPLAALDLGLVSWGRGERVHGGVADEALDADAEARARAALGVA
jgi:hypothetical protein